MAVRPSVLPSFQASTCHSHNLTDVLQTCHAVTHLYLCLCGSLPLKHSSHSLENFHYSSKIGLRNDCPCSFGAPFVRSILSFHILHKSLQYLCSVTQYHRIIYFSVKTTLTRGNLLTLLPLQPPPLAPQFMTS